MPGISLAEIVVSCIRTALSQPEMVRPRFGPGALWPEISWFLPEPARSQVGPIVFPTEIVVSCARIILSLPELACSQVGPVVFSTRVVASCAKIVLSLPGMARP